MSELDELKPCPFCGQPPAVHRCGEGDKAEMIECFTKGCVRPHVSFYGENVARIVWNTRRALSSDGE